MNKATFAAAVATALLAGGVTARAANTSTTPSNPPAYAAPVIADADAMKAADQLRNTNIRQQLQEQLTKAGYSAVKITPTAFFIQAKDKKGDPVAMIIGPDSFTEVTDVLQKPSDVTAQQTPTKNAPTTTQK
jgi:hypothetical protein